MVILWEGDAGYEAIEAGDLKEAEGHITTGAADIVLLDVVLPDGSGISLLETIALLTEQSPTFLQADEVPFRFAGLEGGAIGMVIPEEFQILFRNSRQIEDILEADASTAGRDEASLRRQMR